MQRINPAWNKKESHVNSYYDLLYLKYMLNFLLLCKRWLQTLLPKVSNIADLVAFIVPFALSYKLIIKGFVFNSYLKLLFI